MPVFVLKICIFRVFTLLYNDYGCYAYERNLNICSKYCLHSVQLKSQFCLNLITHNHIMRAHVYIVKVEEDLSIKDSKGPV